MFESRINRDGVIFYCFLVTRSGRMSGMKTAPQPKYDSTQKRSPILSEELKPGKKSLKPRTALNGTALMPGKSINSGGREQF